ncbi:MAG: shikimate kinase [Gemmatimonadota bacterium]|nr:MAG: shikimate kinase [Gemmatimonadota bacterium]
MMNIVLVGFMGTGKTVVGRRLAERLNMIFVDLDSLIEEKLKLSVNEIFERFGERFFREVERGIVSQISNRRGLVVATGGGVVLDSRNVATLKKLGCMIHLFARPDVILERTRDTHHRPLLETGDRKIRIEHLLNERRPFYTQAHCEIDTSDLDVEDVAGKIIRYLQESCHGPRTG